MMFYLISILFFIIIVCLIFINKIKGYKDFFFNFKLNVNFLKGKYYL